MQKSINKNMYDVSVNPEIEKKIKNGLSANNIDEIKETSLLFESWNERRYINTEVIDDKIISKIIRFSLPPNR